jgi:hypothetical protein
MTSYLNDCVLSTDWYVERSTGYKIDPRLVLQSRKVHLVSIINPPKVIIHKFERDFTHTPSEHGRITGRRRE